jgi:hypothetical protein
MTADRAIAAQDAPACPDDDLKERGHDFRRNPTLQGMPEPDRKPPVAFHAAIGFGGGGFMQPAFDGCYVPLDGEM